MSTTRLSFETNGSAKAATFPSPVCTQIRQDKEANILPTSILALTAPDAISEGCVFKSSSDTTSIEAAATWLSDQAEKPTLLIPTLKARFSLSAVQACEAIAMARRFESNGRASG